MNHTLVNLEQVRAAQAVGDAQDILKKRGSSGNQLNGYHSLIITNGLLSTLAFSAAKGGEYALIAEILVGHLAHLQKLRLFPGAVLTTSLNSAIRDMSSRDVSPQLLAMMTDECMAYLNYLKRFARAEEEKAKNSEQ